MTVIPGEGGVSSTPGPIGIITKVSEILDRPRSRTMTTGNDEAAVGWAKRSVPTISQRARW